MPKEEGGQGQVHRESRTAAFRLQFIQKYLMGGEDDVFWKTVTSVILRLEGELEMDASVFLLSCNLICSYEMLMFYKDLFKA